jgi:hypothetical protein
MVLPEDEEFAKQWQLPAGWPWCSITSLKQHVVDTHGPNSEKATALVLARRRAVRGREYSARTRARKRSVPEEEIQVGVLFRKLQKDCPKWQLSAARTSLGVWLTPGGYPRWSVRLTRNPHTTKRPRKHRLVPEVYYVTTPGGPLKPCRIQGYKNLLVFLSQ